MKKDQNVSTIIEAPSLLTVSPSPHIKKGITTRGIMIDVVIALLPALVWSIYVFGINAPFSSFFSAITFKSSAFCSSVPLKGTVVFVSELIN